MGGSLFPADHSGLAGILFGLASLVLFGVTITLVMDGSLTLGGDSSDPASVAAANDAEIAGLEKKAELLTEQQEQRAEWQDGLDDLKRTRSQMGPLQENILTLKDSLAGERVRTRELREAFNQYKTNYRKRLWAGGIGTTLDTLNLPNGKTYRDVRIRSISAVEIRISHADGLTGIRVTDLPPDILQTYHLSAAEARLLREEEMKREQAQLAEPDPPKERTGSKPTPPRRTSQDKKEEARQEARKQARTASLRAEASQLRSQISVLAGQVSEARSQSAYAKRRSPPGSLETWTQRASRLSNLQGKASARLSLVESELRRIDPTYRPPLRR